MIFDPLHYLALFEQKTRALDRAAPLAGWDLPPCLATLRRLLEARLKKHGSREYVQVLRLLEIFSLDEVTRAIDGALQLGTIGFDAVKRAKTAMAGHGELSASATGPGKRAACILPVESFTYCCCIDVQGTYKSLRRS